MQAMLNYDEDETAQLAKVRNVCIQYVIKLIGVYEQITKYTVTGSGDGRIVVTHPLQALTKYGGGVRNSVYTSSICTRSDL